MATTYCKIISYGRRANLNYLNSLLTIFFFDSLWRDLYFRRYPTFFTDADFKQVLPTLILDKYPINQKISELVTDGENV